MKKLLITALMSGLMVTSTTFADNLQNKANQNSSVFEKFDGMEKMASLSEQDKALTGASWLYYKDGFITGSGIIKKMYVQNCNTWTVIKALGFNKSYVGCQR